MLQETKKHLKDVNMTYWEHVMYASKIIFKLKKIELALLVHLCMPAYFKNYASKQMVTLAKLMEKEE